MEVIVKSNVLYIDDFYILMNFNNSFTTHCNCSQRPLTMDVHIVYRRFLFSKMYKEFFYKMTL